MKAISTLAEKCKLTPRVAEASRRAYAFFDPFGLTCLPRGYKFDLKLAASNDIRCLPQRIMLIDSSPRTNDEVGEAEKALQDAEKASLPSVYLVSPNEDEKTVGGGSSLLERLTRFLTKHGIETRGYAGATMTFVPLY